MSKTAYLVLEDGKIFQGKAFGAEKEVIAEVVLTGKLIATESLNGPAFLLVSFTVFCAVESKDAITPDVPAAFISSMLKFWLAIRCEIHNINFARTLIRSGCVQRTSVSEFAATPVVTCKQLPVTLTSIPDPRLTVLHSSGNTLPPKSQRR